MKSKFRNLMLSVFGLVVMGSCEFDDFKEPGSIFEGRIVYQGQPIGIAYNEVEFQLWESGWEQEIPITVTVSQEGGFSTVLFDAEYRLVIPSHQGPFITLQNQETNSDTILVSLNGNRTLDIEVLPYYMISNPQFNASGNDVNASFGLDQIITGADQRNVERVNLYISKTYFVDAKTSISSVELGGGDITDLSDIDLSTGIPEMTPDQSYVYARVGVKIDGVEDMMFSPIQRIDI